MIKKMTHTDAYTEGKGIETSRGVVLLSGELTCRVCGTSEVFEWPNPYEKEEDLKGIDALSLVTAVAHSKNWIVQKVDNVHEGKQAVFVLCPTCLSLFFSATSPDVKTDH